MARRGFTLLELIIVVLLIAVIAAIAIPNMVQTTSPGSNDNQAIRALESIATAESIFREGDKEGDGLKDYGTLSELAATQLIDAVLGSGTRRGYMFEVGYGTTTSEYLWFAVATPVAPTTTGERYYCTNQAGVIFYTTEARFPMNTKTCEIPKNAVRVGK